MSSMALLATQMSLKKATFLARPLGAGMGSVLKAASSSVPSEESFAARNVRLGRPMSPWMVYKFQVTSMLSITHRITGLGLGVVLYGWGISALFSSNTNWAQTLASIHAIVPSSILMTFKVLVMTGIGYHVANGVRHLAWDMGYGFNLKQLYTSGYIVLGISVLVGIASLLKA